MAHPVRRATLAAALGSALIGALVGGYAAAGGSASAWAAEGSVGSLATPRPVTPTAACPVTPYADAAPDVAGTRSRTSEGELVSFSSIWYGGDRLWAGLSRAYGGEWYAGSEGLKVLWVRPSGWPLTVDGRRLDGPASALEAILPEGSFGRIQASSLVFPDAGCWEVTARVRALTLRFVGAVHPAAEHPIRPVGTPVAGVGTDAGVGG